MSFIFVSSIIWENYSFPETLDTFCKVPLYAKVLIVCSKITWNELSTDTSNSYSLWLLCGRILTIILILIIYFARAKFQALGFLWIQWLSRMNKTDLSAFDLVFLINIYSQLLKVLVSFPTGIWAPSLWTLGNSGQQAFIHPFSLPKYQTRWNEATGSTTRFIHII